MKRSILLIISGSIAAIKTPDLVRKLHARNIGVKVILTKAGEQFVNRAELSAIENTPVYTDLFSIEKEMEMGHIRLSRDSDLVVVAPASADIIAKMAHGVADDLASAALLASNKRLLIAPAMNTQMWIHPATERNVKTVESDGAILIPPAEGMLACGEVGAGRMAEPDIIVAAIIDEFECGEKLKGVKALVTSGPTYERIDPVRFLGNRSSGKQGHAIAAELARLGAEVTLVSGPVSLDDPAGVATKHVTSAEEMLSECEKALPADIAVCAAAVADWRVSQPSARKLKKTAMHSAPELRLIENPDILAHIAAHPKHRPELVIGFAAETESAVENATLKLKSKGCDWILANDVSDGKGFESAENQVTLVTRSEKPEAWPFMSKKEIARKLAARIAEQKGKIA